MVTVLGTGIFDGITTSMLMGVFDQVTALVPTVAGVVIAFIGFRKGWSFLRGAIAGA